MIDVLLGRHVEAVQRTGNTLFEHVLELVPSSGRIVAQLCNSSANVGDRFTCCLLGPLLNRLAFLYQGVEETGALLLSLGKRTKSRKPNLGCRVTDLCDQLLAGCRRCFLHFLRHISLLLWGTKAKL